MQVRLAIVALAAVLPTLVPPSASDAQDEDRIRAFVRELYSHPWPGAGIVAQPMMWRFNFTEPMAALLQIGSHAQDALLERITDAVVEDQVIILLGGVGDERAVAPIIDAMQRAKNEPADKRQRLWLYGNAALTNISVADVIWHHGGGLIVDRCPDDPAGCWAEWWRKNRATFSIKAITQSRRYSNYPNYGIYRDRP